MMSRLLSLPLSSYNIRRHFLSSSLSNTATIEDNVSEYLRKECLVKPGTYVLVSVSGGVDSMALLHILSSLSSSLSLSLEVVNFNHKLRKESDDEAVFVESVAKQYGLRYHQRVMPSDILSIISTKRLQQGARDWRRKECLEILKSSLSSLSSSSSSSSSSTTTAAIVEGVIATAHHADDQIETFMMKFLRGVHISNLYPMLPRSDCDHFIKPFLNVNKSIIINYMKANSYQWYEDQSNESKKYKRNEIRLDLIPLLSRLAGGNEALNVRLDNMYDQSRMLRLFLSKESTEYINKHIPHLFHYHDSTIFYKEDSTSDDDIDDNSDNIDKNSISKSIDIDISTDSPFMRLPSIVQLEIVTKIFQYITHTSHDSNSNASSSRKPKYSNLKKIQSLINDSLPNGQRSKVIQMDYDCMAEKLGNTVRFFNKQYYDDKYITTSSIDIATIKHNNITIDYDKRIEILDINDVETTNSTTTNELLGSNQPIKFSLFNIPNDTKLTIRLSNKGDKFSPSWKSNNSKTKLTAFLRGQDVPLHMRDRVIVVEYNNTIIAVPPFVTSIHNNPTNSCINITLRMTSI